jgi:hypothetical protein
MSETRKISVTITGPEGMLEAMAKLLRDEGYTVAAPGATIPSPAPARAPWTAVDLHEALDLLVAQYLLDNPGSLPSKKSVLDLIHWSNVRLMKSGELEQLVERAKAKG